MNETKLLTWFITVLSAELGLSQVTPLACLTLAAAHVNRANLVEIGHQLANATSKHGIKRVNRFPDSDRAVIGGAMAGILTKLSQVCPTPIYHSCWRSTQCDSASGNHTIPINHYKKWG